MYTCALVANGQEQRIDCCTLVISMYKAIVDTLIRTLTPARHNVNYLHTRAQPHAPAEVEAEEWSGCTQVDPFVVAAVVQTAGHTLDAAHYPHADALLSSAHPASSLPPAAAHLYDSACTQDNWSNNNISQIPLPH